MRLRITGGLAALAISLFSPDAGAAVRASELIPDQMALPAPWGAVKLLLLLTFFIHIILVNIVLGSAMLAAAGAWRGKPASGFSLKKNISFASTLLALAVNFGVAPFLFMQVAYGGFLYTSGVLMALCWISVPLLAMLAYYGLYAVKYAEPETSGQKRFLISAIALLLMLVAFFLSANSNLAVHPELWKSWTGGTVLGFGDPSLAPRYLHVLMASLAVAGLFTALRARWRLRGTGAGDAESQERMKYGLKIFVCASLGQAAVGLWYLLSLSAPLRGVFLGQSILGSAFLASAVLGLIGALLAAWRQKPYICAVLAAGVIFIMIWMRDLVRMLLLTPYNQELAQNAEAAARGGNLLPPLVPQPTELTLPVMHGQGAVFAMFLLCAGLGLFVIARLLLLAYRVFYRDAALAPNNPGKGD